MSRKPTNSIVPLNPELEKILRSLKKVRKHLEMTENSGNHPRLVNPNPNWDDVRVEQGLDNGRPRSWRSISNGLLLDEADHINASVNGSITKLDVEAV